MTIPYKPNSIEHLPWYLGQDYIHIWFELTYAQYLTIPRSILEAMPGDWQKTFVECLEKLGATYDWRPSEGRYWVCLKDGKGRYVSDPLQQYRHPDQSYIKGLKKNG